MMNPKGCEGVCRIGLDLCRGRSVPRLCELAVRPDYAALLRRFDAEDALRVADPPADTILFTGGVGDFLALDSWMDPGYRSGIRRVLWAAPNAAMCRALLDACPAWPRVEHRDLWTDFRHRRAWYNFEELAAAVGGEALAGADDWNSARQFPRILAGELAFRGSSLIGHRLADISRLGLPPRYTVVCHGTVSTHRLDRYFGDSDWAWVLAELDRTDSVGVVLGTGDQDPVPDHPRLVNLVDRTSVVEAAEVVKGCSAYHGIDACWSVLAAQVLPAEKIRIRTTVDHVYRYARVYYSPHASYPFLCHSFDDTPAEKPLPVLTRFPTEVLDDRLVICRELGVVLPRHPEPDVAYDAAYWRKYQGYARSAIGPPLNDHRARLVGNFVGCKAPLLDIGIGCGTFLERWQGPGFGHDINPVAVQWLKDTGRWCDPYNGLPPAVEAVTFWDSLEHIRDPQVLLDRLAPGTFAFVALPTFPDLTAAAIRSSRHYRPGEHLHYWSHGGIIKYFRLLGWKFLHTNDDESKLGRESIETFVFRKD